MNALRIIQWKTTFYPGAWDVKSQLLAHIISLGSQMYITPGKKPSQPTTGNYSIFCRYIWVH
jgi:hypothetical protein